MFIVLHLGQPCSSLMERLPVVQAIFVGEQLMVSEFAPAEEEERQRGAVERLALFTDAVVAIVITLMVLEVKPPHIRAEGELLPALRGLWHEYLAVAISFLVIGLFWTRHHALFQWVKRHDARL